MFLLPEPGLRLGDLRPVKLHQTGLPLLDDPKGQPAAFLGPSEHTFDMRPLPDFGAGTGFHSALASLPYLAERYVFATALRWWLQKRLEGSCW